MGDFVKIAVKTALVATIVVAVYQIFASISISLPALTGFNLVIAKGKALLFFYVPWVQNNWSLIITLVEVALGIWAFYFSILAVRWILKVNE